MSRANKYEALGKLIQAFSKPYKGTVYHYTSADGISGIIGKHEIWMSNAAFTNDTTELKTLKNETGILKDNDFTNDAVKERWHKMVDRTRTNEIREPDCYMASFSRKRNSLEQWRGYGNFCIGFEAEKLAMTRQKIFLYECLYTKDKLREWMLAQEKIPAWASLPDDQEQRDIAAFNLVNIAPMKYKSEHFSAEEEIRLVAFSHHKWDYANSPGLYENDLPVHFRPHRLYGFPLPYLKFFIERESNKRPQGIQETETQMKKRKLKEEAAKQRELLPIAEVIVGPMTYQREAKTACEILLSESGYKHIQVSVSDIPFRGL
jgi:hypothetical protein